MTSEQCQPEPVPPGWYADPWWRGSVRYWDGARWTEHAQMVGVATAPPRPALRGLRAPAFVVAFGVLVGIVVGGRLLNAVLERFVHSLVSYQVVTWIFYLLVYGAMAAMVIWVVRRFGTRSLRNDLGWCFRWSDLGWGPLLFIATRLAQLTVTAPLIMVPTLRASTHRYSQMMHDQPGAVLVTMIIVGVLIAPVVEELVFRGVLLRGLLSHVPPPAAAIIQGVVFGCYHFAPDLGLYNIVLITANATFGVIFGFVALRRRSLVTGMIAHSITNASAFVVVILAGH